MITLKIREHSIKYATAERDKILRREEELKKEINTLQNFIDSNESKSAEALNTLATTKRELEEIIEYRTRGSILRARCRWFNESEKIQSTS